MHFVLATRNPGKLREIREVLSGLVESIESLDTWGSIPEPEETGETFAENARDKALYYARAIRETTGQNVWCLADDSGLAVDALSGAPGVRSARYAADDCPPDAPRDVIDQANNRRLLANLADAPDDQRTARFVCHLALADADHVLLEATGTIEGRIGRIPAGENGFGYDPLFFVPQFGRTTAQLAPEQKNAVSHRGQALRKLAAALPTILPR